MPKDAFDLKTSMNSDGHRLIQNAIIQNRTDNSSASSDISDADLPKNSFGQIFAGKGTLSFVWGMFNATQFIFGENRTLCQFGT